MFWIAVKMLMGDRGKYIAMVAGVFFSSLVITQQASIFTGLMTRTFSFINDMRVAQIWVMDPEVQFIDDTKPLQSTQLFRVRGVEGVEWAMPLYKGLLKARLDNGKFQNCNVIGIDDATLTGGPPVMLQGSVADLRRADGVIIDEVGARSKLAGPPKIPGGPRTPLQIGDILELNDNRAVVVGIAKTSRTFQSQPIIYTTYSRATQFAPRERRLLSFILVKARAGVSETELISRINRQTGLAAYTGDEFKELTVRYYIKNTGIPINFGIAVFLGFVVGAAICGQSFYSFTADNMRYFGTLRAMGATPGTLVKMLLLQALIVGLIGYGLGVGLASCTRFIAANSELAFRLPWQLPLFTGVAVMLVCSIAALLSIRKVLTLEPAIVFKG